LNNRGILLRFLTWQRDLFFCQVCRPVKGYRGALPQRIERPGVQLTVHSHLVSGLGVSGNLPPFPLCILAVHRQRFTFYQVIIFPTLQASQTVAFERISSLKYHTYPITLCFPLHDDLHISVTTPKTGDLRFSCSAIGAV
jgi:hypothetical protein